MQTFSTLTLFFALSAAAPHAISHLHLHDHALRLRAPPLVDRAMDALSLFGRQNLSPDGTCGGNTGYQCAAGFCCSQWGYCGQGEAYCGGGGGGSGSNPSGVSTATQPWPTGTTAPPTSPTGTGRQHHHAPHPTASSAPGSGSGKGYGNVYKFYTGNGSPSEGWPTRSDWIDFEGMWAANEPTISISCTEFSETNNSPQENAELKSAIQSVGQSAGIDPRFILAVVMQESKGCVRVDTTDNGVVNPGLMQSHDGSGTCNPGGPGAPGTIPCPDKEITQMIEDGTMGTSSGDGLKQCLTQTNGATLSQQYYQAATIYNSGNLPANLDDNTATACYASDIANRLTGWTTAETTCTA